MSEKCSSKPPHSTRNRLNELLSWRLLKKNPSGALIWAIYGASIVMDGFYFAHFLNRKEYQFDHSKRMWNERVEMLDNPVRMKLFYPSAESVPKRCQPLVDVYKKMKNAEELRRLKIDECIRSANGDK